jgi:hypothetical protein
MRLLKSVNRSMVRADLRDRWSMKIFFGQDLLNISVFWLSEILGKL